MDPEKQQLLEDMETLCDRLASFTLNVSNQLQEESELANGILERMKLELAEE